MMSNVLPNVDYSLSITYEIVLRVTYVVIICPGLAPKNLVGNQEFSHTKWGSLIVSFQPCPPPVPSCCVEDGDQETQLSGVAFQEAEDWCMRASSEIVRHK